MPKKEEKFQAYVGVDSDGWVRLYLEEPFKENCGNNGYRFSNSRTDFGEDDIPALHLREKIYKRPPHYMGIKPGTCAEVLVTIRRK